MNYYKPGECTVHQMTPEELEADRKRQEEKQKFRSATGKKRK